MAGARQDQFCIFGCRRRSERARGSLFLFAGRILLRYPMIGAHAVLELASRSRYWLWCTGLYNLLAVRAASQTVEALADGLLSVYPTFSAKGTQPGIHVNHD